MLLGEVTTHLELRALQNAAQVCGQTQAPSPEVPHEPVLADCLLLAELCWSP